MKTAGWALLLKQEGKMYINHEALEKRFIDVKSFPFVQESAIK